MYWFTADEHFGHKNIIRYCNRPFSCLGEMHSEIIKRHNACVQHDDTVVHLGDFSIQERKTTLALIAKLNGSHIFLGGKPITHDKWIGQSQQSQIRIFKLQERYIIACHYAMRIWPLSYYNSWHIYGHSYGRLNSSGKSYDVGVDCNNFTPVSFQQLSDIMFDKPDNPNLVLGRNSRKF